MLSEVSVTTDPASAKGSHRCGPTSRESSRTMPKVPPPSIMPRIRNVCAHCPSRFGASDPSSPMAPSRAFAASFASRLGSTLRYIP